MLIPFVLSVALAAAMWLVYEGLTNPLSPAGRRRWPWVEDFLIRAGLREVSPRDFVLFSLGSGVVAGGAVNLLLGWLAATLVAGALGALLPLAYYLRRHERRKRAMQTALVEAISQLRDAIKTGLSVHQALASLSRSGPEVLRAEFATLTRETQVNGFEMAVEHMRQRLASPLWDTCGIALVMNDNLGSRQVSQMLHRLAEATRAQLRIEDELVAYQSRTVFTARVVAAVPIALLLVVRSMNGQYLAFFSTPGGELLLLACLVSIITGYSMMLWLGRLPGEPRVFQ